MSLSRGLIYKLRDFAEVFNEFFFSMGFKWFCMFFIIALNYLAYQQNPIRYSAKHKWIMYIVGMGAMTLYLFAFISLWYQTPFTDKLFDGWYFLIVIFSMILLTEMTIGIRSVEKRDDSLNPPPENLWSIKDRIRLYLLILVVDTIIFLQLYFGTEKGQSYIFEKTYFDRYVLSRFGGAKDDIVGWMIGWAGLIGLLFDLIAIYKVAGFRACDYNMPETWDF
jgi:hypothetical protein